MHITFFSGAWRGLLVAALLLLSACGVNQTISEQHMPSSGYVDSNGLRIFYQRAGSGGPPLLLVHGWGADSRSNWSTTVGLSACNSIAPSLPSMSAAMAGATSPMRWRPTAMRR